jgi:Fe-S oxidoreductase
MLENVDRTLRTVLPGREELAPREGDLAFFPGCIAHGRLPEETVASLALLAATGAHPYVPPDWACCGSPLEKIGEPDRLERVRQKNAGLLSGVGEVVASCPGCTVQLRNAYHKEAWHLLEYLHRTGLPVGSFASPAPAVKVALHRPCHLARVVGPHTMDMARELLEAVPGVIVVEHEGEDECCGGGGGVAASCPEESLRMAERKTRSARRSGADLLLAPCPFCVLNLRRAGGMDVQELSVFLAGRLSRSDKP